MSGAKGKSLESLGKKLAEVFGGYFGEPGWPRLRPRSFLVWSALVFKSAPVVGITSVSYDRIRAMTGLGSNATVGRAMDELIDKGYMRELMVGGPSNQPKVYRLLHHRLPDAGKRISHGDVADSICEILEEAAREEGMV